MKHYSILKKSTQNPYDNRGQIMMQQNKRGYENTLFKCPGDHPILHPGLKLNSNISVEKYKKKNSPGPVDFPRGC